MVFNSRNKTTEISWISLNVGGNSPIESLVNIQRVKRETWRILSIKPNLKCIIRKEHLAKKVGEFRCSVVWYSAVNLVKMVIKVKKHWKVERPKKTSR